MTIHEMIAEAEDAYELMYMWEPSPDGCGDASHPVNCKCGK